MMWRRNGRSLGLGGWLIVALVLTGALVACAQSPLPNDPPAAITVSLIADGHTLHLTTTAGNVRQLLPEAGITYSDADLIDPPLFTPLTDGLSITLVRVTESVEIIPQTLPFDRKIVRSDAMDTNDPPRLLQVGRSGLQEVTVRIVYHDGLEVERWPTQVTVIEAAQEEIVMVGIGAARDNLRFAGLLAYMSGGTAVLLRGNTLFPEQLETAGALDGRVFSLSPTGSHLLYTRTTTETAGFYNELWVLATERGATPRPLNVNNVLWAGWNPARTDLLQIAYTTAVSTTQPPGWEANNDLWLGEVLQNDAAAFKPRRMIESYPATFGWWGGNYAWSPQGRYIAYSFANEVGVIDTELTNAGGNTTNNPPASRRILQRFTEFNTLSDWVWVPTLSWSADGRFLAFTNHNDRDPETAVFDSWVLDVAAAVNGRFVANAGMWAHLYWSPANTTALDSQLAFLRATNPLDSQRSSYTLWLMDQDGSNGRQLYPPLGENSRFPREQQFMAWGPTGQDLAFIFNDALYLFTLADTTAYRLTQDDVRASHPTWAPYAAGITPDLPITEIEDALLPAPTPPTLLPEE